MLDNVSLEKVDDGALWMISITDAPLKYNLIGVVTNHEIKITLKDGKTLEELGLSEEKISFNSLWTKHNGAIAVRFAFFDCPIDARSAVIVVPILSPLSSRTSNSNLGYIISNLDTYVIIIPATFVSL